METDTSSEQVPPRRRVLISAYACGPGDEPEASAGWAFARAAAARNDVWIITRRRFAAALADALAAEPDLASHIHVVTLELSPRLIALKRGAVGVYWYYILWQRALAERAADLHREIGFDVAHHVSFANDWLPCGVAGLPVPLVWGPVGGASRMPLWRLRGWLGLRGFATELARASVTGLFRRIFGDTAARRAAVSVAQNPDVAERFRSARCVIVEPNAAFDLVEPSSAEHRRGATPTALFVARLLAWKGGRIAVAALADPRLHDWRLELFGTGYERRAIERLAGRLGVADRVTLRGHRPRAEVLEALGRADVLVFPSMHDQAGWAAAEASAAGVPVVCLPLGGPPVLADRNAHIAAVDGDIARNVATAMLEAAETGGVRHGRWSPARLPALVDGWYDFATSSKATRATTDIIVLESFREPRATSNPYITQLAASLRSTPGVRLFTYSPLRALFGRYDVFHVHWPENLVGGHRVIGRVVRRTVTALLLARLHLTRSPVVRTWHNLDRPPGLGRIDNALLDGLDRLTVVRIRLNETTKFPAGSIVQTIPHGHYRDWYRPSPELERVSGRIAYVGLVRAYKAVERLVEAFSAVADETLSLVIAGRPVDADLASELQAAARLDPRITLRLAHVDDDELVSIVSAAELVALPYRSMHNSGTVLAALSLDRPVLVPRSDVTDRLAQEVGESWVLRFSGELGPEELEAALRTVRENPPPGVPDLSAREWDGAGPAHAEAFRAAISERRGRTRPDRDVNAG